MKLMKDTTTGNVLILDDDGQAELCLTPGPYRIARLGEYAQVQSQFFSLDIDPANVTAMLEDEYDGSNPSSGSGSDEAISLQDLVDWLATIAFDFAPAS